MTFKISFRNVFFRDSIPEKTVLSFSLGIKPRGTWKESSRLKDGCLDHSDLRNSLMSV